MSEPQVVACRRCKRRLSADVYLLPQMPRRELRAGGGGYDPTVPQGYVATDPEPIAVDPEEAQAGSVGCMVAHLEDVTELLVHEDPERNAGCCGHDGLGGPNRRCPGCRSIVATWRDDCWSPQEVRFEPGVTALMGRTQTW